MTAARKPHGASPAIVLLLAAAASGACGDPGGVVLELSSEVAPLDAITLSVFGERGALVVDRQLLAGRPPELPARIGLDAGERRERLRLVVWGWRGDARVAAGAGTLEVEPGAATTVPVDLVAPPSDRDGDGVVDEIDGCPDVADPSQPDGDGDGVTDACRGGEACPGNLIANPGFESGTAGWGSSGGVLSWDSPGRGDARAAQACKDPTGSLALYTINDNPSSVASPTQGVSYHLTAWVRAKSLAPSQNVRPRLRELDAAGNEVALGSNGGVVLATDWQELTADYTIAGTDSSALEVYFSSPDAPDGACFSLDDLCLVSVVP